MLPSFDLTINGDVSKVTPEDMIKVINGFIELTKSYNKLGLALAMALIDIAKTNAHTKVSNLRKGILKDASREEVR